MSGHSFGDAYVTVPSSAFDLARELNARIIIELLEGGRDEMTVSYGEAPPSPE